MKIHVAAVHRGERPLKCELCNIFFFLSMGLKNMLLESMKENSLDKAFL